MRKAGLIVNPRSGKAGGKGLALAGMLRGDPLVTLRVIERFEQIGGFLDDMARAGVTDLFISSGDGTIHELLTQLGERRPFAELPRLALLPHGTTNMTAADLGFRHRPLAALAGAIRTLSFTDLRSRPTIRCVNPRDGRPRHGMFVGTGAAAAGTKYCQDAFNARGIRGQWATFGTLATAVARSLFTAAGPRDLTRLDRPHDITVEADGQCRASGQQLLAMSTTLEKLVLHADPFWGPREGAIRTSVFPYPLPSVVRWLLPVMYGGENRKGPPRTLSFCSDDVSVTSNAMFVIDGEFFDGPEVGPLHLEKGPEFTFLCG